MKRAVERGGVPFGIHTRNGDLVPSATASWCAKRGGSSRTSSLIITGHTSRYPIEDLMANATADFRFKPFRMNELRTRLALATRRDPIDRLHRGRAREQTPQDPVSTIRHP
jgi:hypothetical protein